jgi:hypothetical protein
VFIVKYATRTARASLCAALLAFALPLSAFAGVSPDVPMQYPSAAKASIPPALRDAFDLALAQDPEGTWLEQKVVADDGQASDLFGFRVLVEGDVAFISAPAPVIRGGKVYAFAKSGDAWVSTQTIVPTPASPPPPGWSDFFGWSLSLSNGTLMIGAPFMLDQKMGPIGAVYVFAESDGVWTQTQELVASTPGVTDYFGWAVRHVGDVAVVGANSHNRGEHGTEGAAYVFTNSGGTWSETQTLEPSDGSPGDGRQFGNAIAFDGTTLAVGAPGADYDSTGFYIPGETYLFANDGGTWTETQILAASDSADGDQFGFALAIEGTTLIVGAPAADIDGATNRGAVYAFDGASDTWSETAKIIAEDGVAYDQFGQSVAFDAGNVLIGEWSHNDELGGDPPPAKPGNAYLYAFADGGWNLAQEFVASDGDDNDSFGWDVAMDGSTVLVGAQGTVGDNTFQGAAYFYTAQAIDDRIFANGFDGAP